MSRGADGLAGGRLFAVALGLLCSMSVEVWAAPPGHQDSPGGVRLALPSPAPTVEGSEELPGLADELIPSEDLGQEEGEALLRQRGPSARVASAAIAELRMTNPLEPDLRWLPDALEIGAAERPNLPRGSIVELWSRAEEQGMPQAFDIPISDGPQVGLWIRNLQGRGRAWFEKWLSRIPRYAPVFFPILDRHGLPRDLLFLALIESGLSPRAYSWANAAGPWQFIPDTARAYDLEVGIWLDERRDPERSSEAAARYLSRLYQEFGDWYLAWAAYNAGEGRIRRAIERTGARDFWKLAQTRYLMRETRHYVPKLIAAAVVAKNAKKYGFTEVRHLEPLEWEIVQVTSATDLRTVAEACGDLALEGEIQALNPALYRGITPPGEDYLLRVPAGLGFACSEGLRTFDEAQRTTYRYHPLRPGDRVEELAARYRTTAAAILEFNKVSAEEIAHYDGVIVPIPFRYDAEISEEDPRQTFSGPPPYTPGTTIVRVHRVRPGDSLWRIARKYGVSLKRLRAWNGLGPRSRLRVGQPIRIVNGRG